MTDEERYKNMVDRHDRVIFGDSTTEPPKPGIHQVLSGIWDLLKDNEKGNAALHLRVKNMEDQDRERKAWAGGAKWIIVLLWTVLVVVYTLWATAHN